MEESIPIAGGIFFMVMIVGSLLFALASLAFWIWSLISVSENQSLDSNARLAWILVIVFVGVLGSLIYFFVGRNGSGQIATQNYAPNMPPEKPHLSGKPF